MRRLLLVVTVALVMAAMVVVTAAPAFAAPWWKDGAPGPNPNEDPNCTWGYHTNAIHPKLCWASD
jgi:hypothetical protein